MKRKLLTILFISCLFLTGCFKSDSKDILNDLEKNYKNLKAYHVKGELEIVNNEDVHKYDVDVLFKKDDNYKVSLKNKTNNHEQIILKNTNGVYVLTPQLNKSFKFQSDWPYNNSQVYLIKSIIDDIKNDKERDLTENSDGYVFTTTVNYPNNRNLVRQMIYVDKDFNLKEVKVVNDGDITQMRMVFTSIDLSPNIDSNAFDINSIIKISENVENKNDNSNNNSNSNENVENKNDNTTNNNENNTNTTGRLDDLIYPLYVPSGTVLSNQEKVPTTSGERVIMTFDGEKPFLLVEETSSVADEFEIIPTFGEPCILTDTVAALTDTSITWSSSGVDYYLVSDVMSQDELLDIARSISVIPTMK